MQRFFVRLSLDQNCKLLDLLNFQWASFASGASALRVIALICGSIIICCLWKAKAGRRRQKNQERLLAAISTISSPSGGSSPPSRPPVPTTVPTPIAGSDWIRTPTGWTSVPVHTPSTATSDYNISYITAIYKCFMTSATRENPHSRTRTAVTCPYMVMSIDR